MGIEELDIFTWTYDCEVVGATSSGEIIRRYLFYVVGREGGPMIPIRSSDINDDYAMDIVGKLNEAMEDQRKAFVWALAHTADNRIGEIYRSE